MPNIKQNIHSHNKSTLQSRKNTNETPKLCNCRKPSDCPMAGNCLKESIVYQATVTTEDNKPNQTYVGLTENSFKTRYANHKASFNHPNKRMSTELSKHIWNLKDSNINFRIHLEDFKAGCVVQSLFQKVQFVSVGEIFYYLQAPSRNTKQTQRTCNFL